MFEDGGNCEAERGESSSSHQFFINEVAHAPATPAKPGRPDPNLVRKNWLEYPLDEAIFKGTSVKRSFSCWDGGFRSTSQTYEFTGGMYNKFSMDDVGTWNGISCKDLLALADGGGGSGGHGGGGAAGRLNMLCDLNLPPQTAADPLGLSLQFTPLTPDQTNRADKKRMNLEADKDDSTLVEANQDSEQTNLNETLQPKQKRRKHRPKVVTEGGKPKRGRKPATPKPPDGSSTGKRKYVRRTGVEKSGTLHPGPVQQTKKTCKRKIDFDESEKLADVTSEVVGNYQKVHETETTSPITPSKTELPRGRLERTYTKAKCKINFLQETHDKVQIHVPSPNEPGCSTYIYNKGYEAQRSNFGICYDSLESFLSLYTDYNSYYQYSKKKKQMVSSVYHGHLGYNQNFTCERPYDIHALINQFERMHINRNRIAVVPGYHEKNALVVYQQDRSLVPYVKKTKHRPKVDLDDETNRVWMLLLEDINSKGIDGTDEDKAKWWEEERRIFRGRADSFIARMHLVQGDRRFSQWKGSVLDSVVGVFLTQNVSDHLSSSAFMSLAARYPLKLNTSGPFHEEEPIMFVKEPFQVHESEDHGPVPKMLQEANSCEEKEVIKNNEFSNNCVVSDNSECVVAELSDKDSAIYKKSVTNHVLSEQKDGCKATVGGHTSCVELLHVQGLTRVYEIKSQTKCQMVNTVSSQESANGNCTVQQVLEITKTSNANEDSNLVEAVGETVQKVVDFHLNNNISNKKANGMDEGGSKVKKEKTGKTETKVDWDKLRFEAEVKQKRKRTSDTMDSMDYEAIRKADVDDVADTIKERGMNNRLAERIKAMLDRLVRDHGSTDLEWLRDVPPDKAKEYLLSFRGLGLKSVECIRLLSLHHLAFPVDTNVGRIAVRLGWVPLQSLPESLQLHLLELYPVQESIQKYLWPRLCKLDQKTLYELHYQMITFGKVFCTKTKPNCNACPLRGECRHFASAFASARLALPAPEASKASSTENRTGQNQIGMIDLPLASEQSKQLSEVQNCNPVIEEPATPGPIVEVPATPEPIVEMPASPEPEQRQQEIFDIEEFNGDDEEIPMIKLNIEEFTQNLQTYMERHMELEEGDMSKALVAITAEAASIPTPKLKNVSQLRTEHQVYELPDSHPLLERLDTRETDDPCPYLLAIWTPGETADSIQPPEGQCCSQESGTLCNQETCFFCNSTREANSQTVRGTLLIPCRTAMRGSFPLNGTYFQVNEVFADHESSLDPIDVPRAWLWNLPKRTVYFGTSIPTIFKGLTTEQIQHCFWRGFVCVRGFDRKGRAPRPLRARLHFPASRLKTSNPKTYEKDKLMQ